MEIGNFLFSPSRRNWLFTASLICLLSACDTLTTRVRTAPPSEPRINNETPAPPTPSTVPGRPGAQIAPPPEPPPPTPTVIAPPPKQLPVVGVIFGPGGMKTYAELGVLHAFERARVPIQGVVGFEWGAVIAGLYAQTGQINDAEWKAFRLKEEELPAKGFLSSKATAQDVSALRPFLESGFGSVTVEKSRVGFACPAAREGGEPALWYYRGSMREAVSRCLPYPPMYKPYSGSIAAPMALDDAAAWLRAHGANLIVLIDVLGADTLAKGGEEHYAARALWGEVRRELARAKPPVINYVIHVNTSGTPLDGFEGRRALIDAGQKAAAEPLNKMVSLYGF